MQIILDQFEQMISEKTLKEGCSIFKKGYVGDIDEVAPNTYEASVVGEYDEYFVYALKMVQIIEK